MVQERKEDDHLQGGAVPQGDTEVVNTDMNIVLESQYHKTVFTIKTKIYLMTEVSRLSSLLLSRITRVWSCWDQLRYLILDCLLILVDVLFF